MCQNKEVSLLIVIFATAVIIKLCIDYKNTNEIKYLYSAAYISLLSFIQFTEFFIHAYSPKSNVYQIASLCLVFGIVAQFVFSEICIHKHGNAHNALYVVDAIYYLCFIYFLPTMYNNFGKYNNEFHCTNWFGCKLKWDAWDKMNKQNKYIRWVMDFIYACYFCYATYLVFDIPGLVIFLFTFTIVYIPTLFDSLFGEYKSNGTGSMWCILAVVIILLCLIDFQKYIGSNIKNE